MTKLIITLFLGVASLFVFGQSVDDQFSTKKMKQDLDVFKQIRAQANSGLYKYRTKKQIDSIYHWAEKEIENATTYLDFYNIICQLTDFEGSLHNDTELPKKYSQNLRKESNGYFPYPIKWVDDKWLINYKNGAVPLGAEILAVNQVPISEIMEQLHKYYTTDGINTTGKRIGLRAHFPRYYRLHYGSTGNFKLEYKAQDSDITTIKNIKGIAYRSYYKNFNNRHSKSFDQIYYANLKNEQQYNYRQIDSLTALLTIYSFAIGNETTKAHKTYVNFLDSIFTKLKFDKTPNLIIDVRQCSGGIDPNDVVTYSYLSGRNFQESKQAWISFNKVPLLKYYNSPIPRFLRPLGVGSFNRQFQERFPIEKDGKYLIGKKEDEMQLRVPNENAFTGNIYLLISPAVASAGSLFSAMVAGNENTTTIGEETMGGYYGHNGHTPFEYKLPKSKIVIGFSIDNIEQDVPKKSNQVYNRGIIPDYEVSQTDEDFLNHKDTQMNHILKLIKESGKI